MNISNRTKDYKLWREEEVMDSSYSENREVDDSEGIDLNDAWCDDMENTTINESPSHVTTRNEEDSLTRLMKRMVVHEGSEKVDQGRSPILNNTLEKDFLNTSMWNVLSQLDEELCPMKPKCHKNIIRRLSQEFINSPCKFTEKLVTIIEESAMNNSDVANDSGVSLARLSREFKKLCKFIEDESMPEMAPSFIDCAPDPDSIHGNLDSPNNLSFLTKWKIQASPNKKSFSNIHNGTMSSQIPYLSPIENQGINYTTPKKKFRNTITSARVFNDSVALFEQLEAECNKLYWEEETNSTRPKPLTSLQTTCTDENDLRSICERQMASLDDTLNFEKKHLPTIDSKSLPKPTSEIINYTTPPSRYTEKKPSNASTNPSTNPSIHLNEFDRSILYEMAEQRQRCLDTAKTIIEINSDLKTTQVEIPFVNTPEKNNFDHDSNVQFLNTLMSCEKYYNYLQTERDRLTNLIRDPPRTEIHATPELISFDTPKCNTKLNDKENFSPITLSYDCKNIVKTKMSPFKSIENKLTPKSRLFSSPGKNSVTLNRKKPVSYFTNATNHQKVKEIKHKSPYNVVSPIALYINGNDNGSMLKNVLAKTGRTPLTPQKRTNPKWISPRLK